MKDAVEAKLRSIGKSVFIKYYHEFKNTNYDQQQLAERLLRENPKATSVQAQRTRISNAKSIFENNLHIDALEIIVHSKVDPFTIKEAKRFLKEEK